MRKIFEYLNKHFKTIIFNRKGNQFSINNKRLSLDFNFECDESSFYDIKKLSVRTNCTIRIRGSGNLILKNGVSLNNNCLITCRKKVIIGEKTNIGPNCCIFDHDHDYSHSDRLNNYISSPIIIGKNVWIGANVSVLKGTIIGDNCVIGAGSVVKGTFPNN